VPSVLSPTSTQSVKVPPISTPIWNTRDLPPRTPPDRSIDR
jgi:hypothetical protein